MKELMDNEIVQLGIGTQTRNTDQSDNKQKLIDNVKKGWDVFHRYFVYVLIALAIGTGIGIKISKMFYADKMDDCITGLGLVYKGKAYTLIPK